MDRELPDEDRQRILDIVRRHPGVRSVHDLRTRSSGLHQFIQLHLVLHPTMSLGRAHVISDSVEADDPRGLPAGRGDRAYRSLGRRTRRRSDA